MDCRYLVGGDKERGSRKVGEEEKRNDAVREQRGGVGTYLSGAWVKGNVLHGLCGLIMWIMQLLSLCFFVHKTALFEENARNNLCKRADYKMLYNCVKLMRLLRFVHKSF